MRAKLLFLACLTIVLLASPVSESLLPGARALQNWPGFPPNSLAPYVPTPQAVVDRMLEMGEVTGKDVLYDLGCGDGRIVISAARKYGARGTGYDIDQDRINESRANAKAAGVEHLVNFVQQDVMDVDLSPASVVTIYLLPESNLKLRPRLTSQLRPGSRVVSHAFDMDDWEPLKVETILDHDGLSRTIYLWKIDGQFRP